MKICVYDGLDMNGEMSSVIDEFAGPTITVWAVYILQQDDKMGANCDFVRMWECLIFHNMPHDTEEKHEQRI